LGSIDGTALNSGTVSLAAQDVGKESAQAISAKVGKIGGLDEDGPAAAELNQPKGADLFLLLQVEMLGLTFSTGWQLTAAQWRI
jgi:hypothetical protein